ncbi:hypothetical protein K474DRAFT_1704558 [Panus rudis PR-1116 ss-1]|nr:hypothetical protein K474DRAFT_1704558 [Panus rudis PR-1116 ss-1]
MATASAPNPRASLLAGLRTGGVRSASNPMANVPHTAAPGASFNVPRFPSQSYKDAYYTPEEADELADMVQQNLYLNSNLNRMQVPMTAAVDGSANRFAQQQAMGGGVPPLSPFVQQNAQAQMQALQLQLMQAEIARLQALQVQQQQQAHQAEILAQAQRQQQRQSLQHLRRGGAPPASAGPTATSFDLRTATMRRMQQQSKLGVVGEDQVPMTASLGGRFGSRIGSGSFDSDDDIYRNPPTTPNHTTVISGGTSLGGGNQSNNVTPSKSDAAVSWRSRSNNSVLNGNRLPSAPGIKITPPPTERTSPSETPVMSPIKTRPQPLRLAAEVSESVPSVTIITTDAGDGDDSSSTSSRSNSSPSTPRTASSMGDAPPLSPREEAAKKLYEGLGIGRPAPSVTVVAPPSAFQRAVSQPVRQPRGPPSNNEELVPKNFATRSRRKAIGAILDASARREVVEAY